MRWQYLLVAMVMGAFVGSPATAVQNEQNSKVFKSLASPCKLKGNPAFVALRLPSGEDTQQWQSSSNARISQTDGCGEGIIDGKAVRWAGGYSLENGCWMVHSNEALLVDAGPARVFVAQGTNAVLHRQQNATRIVNLTDTRRTSLQVVFAHRVVNVDPGQELVLVESTAADVEAVAVHEGIGWKDMHSTRADNLCVFLYRVSAADILKKCKIYLSLANSTDKTDIKIREDMVKTVAALETMYNQKKGPFYLDPYTYGQGKSDSRKQAASNGAV